jgi:hypothetical protein
VEVAESSLGDLNKSLLKVARKPRFEFIHAALVHDLVFSLLEEIFRVHRVEFFV